MAKNKEVRVANRYYDQFVTEVFETVKNKNEETSSQTLRDLEDVCSTYAEVLYGAEF